MRGTQELKPAEMVSANEKKMKKIMQFVLRLSLEEKRKSICIHLPNASAAE